MRRYIFHALRSGPKVVERMLRVFPDDRLDERLEEDRFTAREVIGHLADVEKVHLDRIRMIVSKPGISIEAIDSGRRAIEHHYADKNAFHEAAVFESRRGMTMDFLDGLTDEQLGNTFVAPRDPEMSLIEYCASMVSHDMYHIEQLSMYLANEAATMS